MPVHHCANEHVNDLQPIRFLIYCLRECICHCSLFPGLSVYDSIFHFDIPLSASYPSQPPSLAPFPLHRVTALHRRFSPSCYRFSTRLTKIDKSPIGVKTSEREKGENERQVKWTGGVTVCYREESSFLSQQHPGAKWTTNL